MELGSQPEDVQEIGMKESREYWMVLNRGAERHWNEDNQLIVLFYKTVSNINDLRSSV